MATYIRSGEDGEIPMLTRLEVAGRPPATCVHVGLAALPSLVVKTPLPQNPTKTVPLALGLMATSVDPDVVSGETAGRPLVICTQEAPPSALRNSPALVAAHTVFGFDG